MKKRIFLLAALAAGLVLCLTACGETNGDPVTVTLWHVYGGEVNSPMNALVEEFNLNGHEILTHGPVRRTRI